MLTPQTITLEVTFTDVSLETFSLLSGVPLLDLINTPQNRDTLRRATLTKADS